MASLTRDPTRPGQIRGWTRSVSFSAHALPGRLHYINDGKNKGEVFAAFFGNLGGD